jgi:hypothetical protein
LKNPKENSKNHWSKLQGSPSLDKSITICLNKTFKGRRRLPTQGVTTEVETPNQLPYPQIPGPRNSVSTDLSRVSRPGTDASQLNGSHFLEPSSPLHLQILSGSTDPDQPKNDVFLPVDALLEYH